VAPAIPARSRGHVLRVEASVDGPIPAPPVPAPQTRSPCLRRGEACQERPPWRASRPRPGMASRRVGRWGLTRNGERADGHGRLVQSSHNNKGRPEAALDIPHSNSLWCSTFEKNRGGSLDGAHGCPLPRRSAGAATALEALLLLSCPIIHRVYGSARSSPGGLPQSCRSAARGRAPASMRSPARYTPSWTVIGGRRLGLPPPYQREMPMGNGSTTGPALRVHHQDDRPGVALTVTSVWVARTSAATQL
jgi:hypothetical protein